MASEAVVDLVVNAAGADAEISSQLTQIVNDAEHGAPPIELDVEVTPHGVSSQVSDVAHDAELGAPLIELGAVVEDGSSRDVNSAVSQIVAAAEQNAPLIDLGAGVAAESSHDVSSAVSEIVAAAEDGASPIELGAVVAAESSHDVNSAVSEIVTEAEQHAPPIEIDVVVGDGSLQGVNSDVSQIVAAAEAAAPPIEVQVVVEDGAGAGVSASITAVAAAAEAAAPAIELDVGIDESAAASSLSSAFSGGNIAGVAGKAFAVAFVATALPFITTLISGSVIVVGGLGIIGIGAALLKNDPEVKKAATKLKDTVLGVFQKAAEPLKKPFIEAMESLGEAAERLAPQIEKAFSVFAESGAIQSLADGIEKLVSNLLPGFTKAMEKSGEVFEGFEELLSRIGKGLGKFFGQIAEEGPAMKKAFEDLGTLLEGLLTTLGFIFAKLAVAYEHVRDFVGDVIDAFQRLYDVLVGNSIVPDMMNLIIALFKGLPGRAASALASLGSAIVGLVTGAMSSMVATVQRGIAAAVGFIASLPGRASSALSGLGSALVGSARAALVQLGNTVLSNIRAAAIIIGSLPNRALDALGDLGGLLINSGRALIDGFIRGITSRISGVQFAVQAVMFAGRQFFPFSPAKKGPFSGKGWTLYSGRKVIDDFVRGIEQREGTIPGALSRTLRGEPRLGGSPGATLAANASAALSARVSQSFALVGAPNVAVYIGNERLNGFVDSRIDGRNSVRDRQAAQGARF